MRTAIEEMSLRHHGFNPYGHGHDVKTPLVNNGAVFCCPVVARSMGRLFHQTMLT
ncbi:hypothetical protein Bpfe_014203, partial [Biomphalaria pfeifferi]